MEVGSDSTIENQGQTNENHAHGMCAQESIRGTKAKRSKQRPCDACRKRRSKCVIEEPNQPCFLCNFHSIECTFRDPPQKKKKLTDSASAQDPVPLHSELAFEFSNLPEIHLNPTTPSNDSIIRAFEQEQIITSAKTENSNYCGASSEWDPSLINLLPSGSVFLSPVQGKRLIERRFTKITNESGFLHVEVSLPFTDTHITNINTIVGPHGPVLVELYFRIVHSSFPIVDKNLFFQQYETNPGSLSPSLLACLYLFALNWWTFEASLSLTPKPSQEALETLAEEYLAIEVKQPTLSTVQAGLLLIQHQNFRDEYAFPGRSWALQAQIVAIAQQLGLEEDCSAWTIPFEEKILRRRVAWALFMQEKWLALNQGKRSHIQTQNWGCIPLRFEDLDCHCENGLLPSDGSIDAKIGGELFIEMVTLSTIVSGIQDKLYSRDAQKLYQNLADPITNLKCLLETLRPLQQQLKDWESRVPSQLLNEDVPRGHISPIPNLQISIIAARNYLLKPALTLLVLAKSKSCLVDREFIEIQKVLFDRTFQDFQSAVNFLSAMKAEHFQTFWYCSAKHAFSMTVSFGVMVMLSAGSNEDYMACLDKLEEFRWKLQINSKTAEFLQHSRQWQDQLSLVLSIKFQTLARLELYKKMNYFRNSRLFLAPRIRFNWQAYTFRGYSTDAASNTNLVTDLAGDKAINIYVHGIFFHREKGKPAYGGGGVYIAPNHRDNLGFRVTGNDVTALTADLTAVREALRIVIKRLHEKPHVKHQIIIDSEMAYVTLTKWIYRWMYNGWVNSKDQPVANRNELAVIMYYRKLISKEYRKRRWGTLRFKYVVPHKNSHELKMAETMAVNACRYFDDFKNVKRPDHKCVKFVARQVYSEFLSRKDLTEHRRLLMEEERLE
ncbi:hypothetical protein OGAPHI_000864 [Ogataea philodendri]|uniref:Zn(2)-C6 fungal-type domain-containing protein n=1 Tax=Ogataea philodendri TaxID=1378263 RepID=A0A9P8PF64_9ASCO|nr:uncharacterized protein OGAPHI_000864 [Ogataea philodendri]KAH3671153.1 hypothetical protein OGAPHI_000864 [Ogataea philodendri]